MGTGGDATNKIIIADDHPVFRQGFRRVIQPLCQSAEIIEASSWDEVMAAARSGGTPGTFVLDLIFPGCNGPASIRALREEFRDAAILILSMIDDAEMIEALLGAGADGFLGKAASPGEITLTLRAIWNGEVVVQRSPVVTDALNTTFLPPPLTPRQREVLRLVSQGKTNKEIGRELGISPFTVRIHVSTLLHLLNAPTRSAAAAKAVAAGL